MDNIITVQDLKVKGTKALKEKTGKNQEAFITVRGAKTFVVMSMQQYNYLRECELEGALKEAEGDLANGKFAVKSIDDHIKDLKNV